MRQIGRGFNGRLTPRLAKTIELDFETGGPRDGHSYAAYPALCTFRQTAFEARN
jgi:hypothetical protein